MDFADFRRVEPPLPADVSPIYFKLFDEVDARGGEANARIIKFCIAYTVYSVRKKDLIQRAVEARKSPQHPDIRTPFGNFEQGWILEAIIEEARATLQNMISELQTATAGTAIEEVKTTTAEIKKAVLHSAPWWQRPFIFLGHCLVHALQLAIGFLIILLIARLFDVVAPTLVDTMLHFIDEQTQPFRH